MSLLNGLRNSVKVFLHRKRTQKKCFDLFKKLFSLAEAIASKNKSDYITDHTLDLKLKNNVLLESGKIFLRSLSPSGMFQFSTIADTLREEGDWYKVTDKGLELGDIAKLDTNLQLLRESNIVTEDCYNRASLEVMIFETVQVCSSRFNVNVGLRRLVNKYWDNHSFLPFINSAVIRLERRLKDNDVTGLI